MSKPTAVVIGSVGQFPYAGMTMYYLHHVAGLHRLGYDVTYVERQNQGHTMTDDTSQALAYLAVVLPRFGVDSDHYSFIDRAGNCAGGLGWDRLRNLLSGAEFLLTVASPTWFDELERCRRRLYIDADPVFTQVAMLTGVGSRAAAATHYDCLFTSATRIGQPDCTVPTAGRKWNATRTVIDTAFWTVTKGSPSLPLTALMNWAASEDLEYEGRTYGHKNREFGKFIDLPRRSGRPCRLAVAGRDAPKAELAELGWDLVSPARSTQTIDAYRAFIAGSSADLGVAKQAYVATRSGWFSDRSTCFLASGRPVLHQDTGCGEWLPVGEGILLFSDMDSLLAALDSLDSHYETHARAARAIAEEYFEASTVLAKMLQTGGLR